MENMCEWGSGNSSLQKRLAELKQKLKTQV